MSVPKIVLISSLEKIMPEVKEVPLPIQKIEMFQNETASFQIMIYTDEAVWADDLYVVPKITSVLRSSLSVFSVRFVPCLYPAAIGSDNDYISKKAGLFPDVLTPYDGQPLRIRAGVPLVLWVEIDPAHIPSGTYSIEASLYTRGGRILDSSELQAVVFQEKLPKQQLRHTEWFHCDCLCDRYHVEPFSQKFYEIARRYIAFACRHGINTLLTPVFTPSLDVEEGGHRRRAQLIRIKVENGIYSFDFSMLDTWVKTFLQCGIEYFEISHFFTQWGAKYAVEIYAEKDGKDSLLFGWNTPADTPEYEHFLSVFLPQLTKHFEKMGLKDKIYFHISDEPSCQNVKAYRKDQQMVVPYIDGCPIIDAISDYSFYQQGLIDHPVVACDCMKPFAENHTSHLWTYYCCSQIDRVPNRFIAQPSRRNRVLGILLYQYHCEGFLHWGFNYWYSQLSKNLIDPYSDTDAGTGFPSGDPFLAYPGPNGEPVASIRLKVLRDAMQDLRALELLEEKTSRNYVQQLITEICGPVTFENYPRDNQTFLKLRERINREIMAYFL